MSDAITPSFDPVNTPLEAIDLTNGLIMHSVIRALQDEVLYWRETEACRLANAQRYVGEPDRLTTWLWSMTPERQLREHVSALSDALEGRVIPRCFMCDHEIRPGDPVVYYSDEGEGHARCSGATEADIAAGRMAIPLASLDLEELEPDAVERMKADPHAGIHPASALFTPVQIRETLERGAVRLQKVEGAEETRQRQITEHFAASQDDVGARYGLTTSTDKSSVSACRVWFTDLTEARAYADSRALTVWDLVKGEPVDTSKVAA